MDALCALLDCALGISPVTSYSGVKKLEARRVRLQSFHLVYTREGSEGGTPPKAVSSTDLKTSTLTLIGPTIAPIVPSGRRKLDPKTPVFLLSVSDTVVVPAGEEWCWWQCTVKGGREIRDISAVELAQACEELGEVKVLEGRELGEVGPQ